MRKGSRALLLCAGLAFTVAKDSRADAARTASDDNNATNPGITLRVYNYARAPSPILVNAEQEASNIFRRAGVETTWLDRRLSGAEPRTPACEPLPGPADLTLRLFPASMARPFAKRDDTCGFALAVEKGAATDAYILYEPIVDLARTASICEQQILGAVVAHEVGHLLLGMGHSPPGFLLVSRGWG